MNDNILNHDTTNTTKPSSEILPPIKNEDLSIEQLKDMMYDTFNKISRDHSQSFKDGDVHLIREEFDIIHFTHSIHNIIEDTIKENTNLTSEQALTISNTFNAIKSITDILRNSIDTKHVEHICIIKLISYCLTSYIRYTKTYDRSRRIQEQKSNVKGR